MDLNSETVDERSALLRHGTASAHRNSPPDDGAQRGTEECFGESKSPFYLFLLTLGLGGLQIAWATEMSNGSPFLISLGMSKAVLALVWIAGPLSGILVQPYIGSLSDRCRLRWGKRRPFIVGGTVATVASLLSLAWCREIIGIFHASSEASKLPVIIFAVCGVYVLDFSINTGSGSRFHEASSSAAGLPFPTALAVQATLRALVVDCAPSHQQEDANAWASRLIGVGNIIGHLSAFANLPELFPFLGNTQFKVLCAIASLSLSATVAITCLCISERFSQQDNQSEGTTLGLIAFFRSTFRSFTRLPPLTRKVCEVQLLNWIGWFPFLFYVSTYVGQLFVNPILERHPHLSPGELDSIWEKATRVGSLSLLVYAIVSLGSNTLLPFFINPTYSKETWRQDSSATRLDRFVHSLQIPWLTIRRAWLLSHILFAICMALTFFITSAKGGVALAGIVGISWSLTLWAPFALISLDISRLAQQNHARLQSSRDMAGARGSGQAAGKADDGYAEDQAGIVLGLHNVALCAPQVISTLISSAIFNITQRNRGEAGDDSVGWVLRFGGLAALVAAFMTTRIDERWATQHDSV